MIDGQSEQLKSIRKAMKVHEIVTSDSEEFKTCKQDLMTKVAMDEGGADEVAHSIRDMFLPKLLKSEGLNSHDMPEDFNVKMTETDDNFENEPQTDRHEGCCGQCGTETATDSNFDDNEVGEDEIATIHITVPADKLRDVKQALESVLSDTDAISKDHAIGHKDTNDTGEKDMTNKEIEARKALRKTVLAAMAEEESVSRKDGFDHDKSEQYREEEFYDTKKGNIKDDPDFATLDYAENKVPNFSDTVDNDLVADLGLHESLKTTKFDGTPEDTEEYSLDFDEFEVPSQGNTELYNEFPIPSEGKLPHKRTLLASSTLGDFDPDAAEEALAFALKTAGVEDEDLVKLTYAEALDLFKAIRTAQVANREHYTKDGVMDDSGGFAENCPKDPDKKAVTETGLRDHTGEEEDPEKDHERSGPKELYSSSDNNAAYAAMLKKLMKESANSTMEVPEDMPVKSMPKGTTKAESKDDPDAEMHKAEMEKTAELYRARLKTAFAMSSKVVAAGLLPADQLEVHADGMLSDGLSVKTMLRQTNLWLNSAAETAERFAASSSNKAVRTASNNGIGYNPMVRGERTDSSGALDIQNALKNIGWTAPKTTEVED